MNHRFAGAFVINGRTQRVEKGFCKAETNIARINCQTGSETLGLPVSLLADAWSL
jgi:hypothetical protein